MKNQVFDIEIAFLPWIKYDEKIELLGYELIAYKKFAHLILKEQREFLDKIFTIFKEYNGNLVKDLTIITVKQDYSLKQNILDSSIIRNIINILMLVNILEPTLMGILENNKTIGPPNSNIYEIEIRRFNVNDKYYPIFDGNTTQTGLEIKKLNIYKPWATGGIILTPSTKLINIIERFYSLNNIEKEIEKINRCFDWFKYSHFSGNMVSELNKVVMMTTAFEILLYNCA